MIDEVFGMNGLALFFSFIFTFSGVCRGMPIEQEGRGGQSAYPWLTGNRFRIVMQCQNFRYGSEHQIAWVELDSASMKAALSDAQWDPDTFRVIEYDAVTKQPIAHNEKLSGPDAFFVPSKIDKWPRRQGRSDINRDPHLSWLRRPGDASNAVYICYFDAVGSGEQASIVEPAYIGTGDALSYGRSGVDSEVRGYPLVFDFDGDGKKDLLGAIGTVPEWVTYFYKNIDSASEPSFAKPVPISLATDIKGCRQIADVDNDGKLDACGVRGGYYSDVCNKGFSSWVAISLPLDSEAGQIIDKSLRTNWSFFDWDGDGINDVIVGCDYWKEYGWSNAFDDSGTWTNGPLRGWFYFFKNNGSDANFDLAEPVQLYLANGNPAELYGFANPVVADFNGDGLPDIVASDFLDGIYIFKNIGSRTEPVLDEPKRIATTEGDFHADFQANSLFSCDFDDDGDPDLFTRSENDVVGYLENTGQLTADERPVFQSIRYPQCETDYLTSGQLPAIDLYDWDGDGDLDLIYGDSPGFIGWYECISAYPSLKFAERKRFKDQSGSPIRIVGGENGSIQGPAEGLWGYTVPCAGDWDGDGYPDIMLNSIWGKIVWFKNPGAWTLDGQPVVVSGSRILFDEDPETWQTLTLDMNSLPGPLDTTQLRQVNLVFNDPVGVYVDDVRAVGDLDDDGVTNSTDVILFDDAIVKGAVQNAIVTTDAAYEGTSSVYYSTESTLLSVFKFDLIGSVETGTNRYLQMRINFDPSKGVAKLRRIQLISSAGTIYTYEPDTASVSYNLEEERPVEVEWPGAAPKPVWRWWNPQPKEWSTQWRSTVQMIDWDGDGLLDVAALDTEGYLVLHRRYEQSGDLFLGPGERIFKNSKGEPWQINPRTPGSCGRRKFEFVDWDQDGDYDLIVDNKEVGGNVSLYKNMNDNASPKLVLDDSLADIVVSGHTCSPAVFDLEGDGVPDLLLAAEDGHFYCFHRSYIDHKDRLQAFFVGKDQLIKPSGGTVLFDDKIVAGQVLNAEVTDQDYYSGKKALYAQNDSNTFFSVSLDLIGNIDILDADRLELYINFHTDSEHLNTDLKWVQVITYNGPFETTGITKYYPYAKNGEEAAIYSVDDVPQTEDAVVRFDADEDTWQKMTLDLSSGPGMPVVESLKPSSVVRRIDFVFKGPTQVYIDEVRAIPEGD